MSSAIEGFLNGTATGMNRAKDRKERDRELSALEKLASRPSGGAPGIQGYTSKDGGGGAGGGGAGQTFTYDGKIGDRVAHAFKRFTGAGVPSHAAAGLVGNMMQESGEGINPAAVGDNGNAFGSGQMNGPRKDAYMAFASSKGVDPTDFDTQIDWMIHEGKTTEKGAWDAVLGTKTAEEAALVASQKYWRPGTPHNERRQGFATSVYSSLGQAAQPVAQAPQKSVGVTEATAGKPKWSWFKNYTGEGQP